MIDVLTSYVRKISSLIFAHEKSAFETLQLIKISVLHITTLNIFTRNNYFLKYCTYDLVHPKIEGCVTNMKISIT